MPPKPPFQSIPTVASVDANLRRVAARLAAVEVEMSGEEPTSQLARVWESIEELNLRCLFLMETLRITQVMSPIAGVSGQQPKRTIPALEAYMVGFGDGAPSGREVLIARIMQEAERRAQEENSGQDISPEDGAGEGEAGAAPINGAEGHAPETPAVENQTAAGQSANDADRGAPTLVGNDSKTKH